MTRRMWLSTVGIALAQGKYERAEELLKLAVAEGKPKAASLVILDGAGRFAKGFGEAQVDSKFLLASISKPMTAAGVMWLVEKGKLRLEDSLSRYMPTFSSAERGRMQVRHLLTHTCGLPDMLPENTELRKENAPLEEYVRLALTTPLLFPPGLKWSYSSTGILLAAELARRIDGRPIARLLEDEIFKPLGMKDTVLGLGRFRREDMVRSQTEFAPGDLGGGQSSENWDWNSQYWRSLGAPWGGVHGSANDVAKFVSAFLEGAKPLRRETLDLMVRNQNAPNLQSHGIGWGLGARLGKGLAENAFGHGGSTGTLCWADPNKKRIFVLLTSLPDVVARKKIIAPLSELVSAE